MIQLLGLESLKVQRLSGFGAPCWLLAGSWVWECRSGCWPARHTGPICGSVGLCTVWCLGFRSEPPVPRRTRQKLYLCLCPHFESYMRTVLCQAHIHPDARWDTDSTCGREDCCSHLGNTWSATRSNKTLPSSRPLPPPSRGIREGSSWLPA